MLTNHQQHWQRFSATAARGTVGHAVLLVGPLLCDKESFAFDMATTLLCQKSLSGCHQCPSCRLAEAKQHPDLLIIKPEQTDSPIKIEQIRDLHTLVYTSTQIAPRRVIILQQAERLNVNAANALLKLLEEPPTHVHFILLAEQISTIPVTILSRCQQWRFNSTLAHESSYLALIDHYPPEMGRAGLATIVDGLIDDLLAINAGKQAVCTVAARWSAYPYADLLWLLYLLCAELIRQLWLKPVPLDARAEQLMRLATATGLFCAYDLLDKITEMTAEANNGIHVNALLALEHLLLKVHKDAH